MLKKIARELPADAVQSMSIFCRALNTYPVGSGGVHAVPLTLPLALQDWT